MEVKEDEQNVPVVLTISPEFMDGWCALPEPSTLRASHNKISVTQDRRRLRHLARCPTTTCVEPLNELRVSQLIQATQDVDKSAVGRLLASGVPASAADKNGRTALHVAASKGSYDIVELLLSHGANPNLVDVNGNTPFQLAAGKYKTEIKHALSDAGSNMKFPDQPLAHPLAVVKNSMRSLQRLSRIKVSETEQLLSQLEHQRLATMVEQHTKAASERTAVEAITKLKSLNIETSDTNNPDSLPAKDPI